jgi:hypothetical protein
VAELLMAGDQVPEIPLFEVVGKVKFVPEHIGSICVKTAGGSVVIAIKFTGTMAVMAQEPIDGVKV